MPEEIAINIDSLGKSFRLPHEKHTSIKSLLFNGLRSKNRAYEKQEVLKNISFDVKKGEFFGIVGRNGSGKSTLLKLLAGVYSPDFGQINIKGKLIPFIELGVGFNPELSGRENVFLNGALLGFTRKEVESMYREIVDFAELERFMDQKLKNYSSGMQVRLAFSIAIRAKSDILLIDEVLAVGDEAFQKKCFNVFKEIKKSGRTVVFVTHDMGAVEEFCDRALLIEEGRIKIEGKSYRVAREYRRLMSLKKPAFLLNDKPKKRWGDGSARIQDAKIKTINGFDIKKLNDKQDSFVFQMEVKFNREVDHPIFGITLRNASGLQIFLSNSKSRKTNTGKYRKGAIVHVTWELMNVLNTGSYTISPAVADSSGLDIFDWLEDFVKFDVIRDNYLPGIIHYGHKIKVVNSND